MFRYSVYRHLLKITLVIFFFPLSINLSAQIKNPVSGTVFSRDENEPISGVSILWENKGIGATTNSDGKFIILLPSPYAQTDSLIFSCIGYKEEKINIRSVVAGKNVVIQLNKAIENLKEVVVKPLSLKQLLDSLIQHNKLAFAKPIGLKGYYREFVYTNEKCTEFSDALCEYFYDGASVRAGELMINASRCLKALIPQKEDRHDMEVDLESSLSPNLVLKYALLSGLIERYFPDKQLPDYDYTIEQADNNVSGNTRITIFPKRSKTTGIYKWVLTTTNDFTLKAFHFEIPAGSFKNIKEKSLLGLHSRSKTLTIDIHYSSTADGIYPNYYSMVWANVWWGHFLGVAINNEVTERKSEFVTTEIRKAGDAKPFEKKSVYKKGNLCGNGIAMNDSLLKNYTIIMPTRKDSASIKSLNN